MSGQKWDSTDWGAAIPSTAIITKNALFEETWTQLQRNKINARKYTPNSKMLFPSMDSFSCYSNIWKVPVASALRQNWSVSSCRMQQRWRWLAQFESFIFSSNENVFRFLEVLHPALLALPVVQNTFSFYFYSGNEQLVVTAQNSITNNSVERSICRRDVPWIHLEKTQFSNLTLLIIYIYIYRCQFYWFWSCLFSSGIF